MDAEQLKRSVRQLVTSHVEVGLLFKEIADLGFSNDILGTDPGRLKAPAVIGCAVSGMQEIVKEQVAVTGLCGDVLAAKLLAAEVLSILGVRKPTRSDMAHIPQDHTKCQALLEPEQRTRLVAVLGACSELLKTTGLSRPHFLHQLQQQQLGCVPLELLWCLHVADVVPLHHSLASWSDDAAAAVRSCVASSLLELLSVVPGGTESPRRETLQGLLVELVRVGYGDAGQDTGQQVCVQILDLLLHGCTAELVSGAPPPAPARRLPRLNPWELVALSPSVPLPALRTFCSRHLSLLLSHDPRLKVADAVSRQAEWSFAKMPPFLFDIYRQLMLPFGVEELIPQFESILGTQELNWPAVLSCVSALLACFPKAHVLLQDMLRRLLTQAFCSYEVESLVLALLLARQAALGAAGGFTSYTRWFQSSFGDAKGFHVGSKKSLLFLLKFLSELVPFEPPHYLKIHILNPPFVELKQRAALMEYVSLARTRLVDLKEPIEEMGLYADPVEDRRVQDGSSAHHMEDDVEKTLVAFERTGKIPSSVMEASIFRRPYFLMRFLPALLKTRRLPDDPDVRMAFIEAMRRADKIPSHMFRAYVEACSMAEIQQQHGQQDTLPVGGVPSEPMDVVRQSLESLPSVASLAARSPDTQDAVSHLVLLVDEYLRELHGADPPQELRLGPVAKEHLQLVDLLLNSFCKAVTGVCAMHHDFRLPDWSCRFVLMLAGLSWLHKPLLSRVWALLLKQGQQLSDCHILGLAALLALMHQYCSSFPPVTALPASAATDPAEPLLQAVPFTECVGAALPCSSAVEMLLSLRLCTALLSFSLSGAGAEDPALSKNFTKKFLFLADRVSFPRKKGTSADGSPSLHLDPFLPQLAKLPHISGVEAACSVLASSSSLQCSLEQHGPRLGFSEWLQMELRVDSERDFLTHTERFEHQRWKIFTQFLPCPVAHGGCGSSYHVACKLLLSTLLHTHAQPSKAGGRDLSSPCNRSSSCFSEFLCRLQEVAVDVEVPSTSLGDEVPQHWLLEGLRESFQQLDEWQAAGQQQQAESSATPEQETLMHSFVRVLLGLPAETLLTRPSRDDASLRDLFSLTNNELRAFCCEGSILPQSITLHITRGILLKCSRSPHCYEAVASVWLQLLKSSPLLFVSITGWWLQLRPVLSVLCGHSPWKAGLPNELLRLDEAYSCAQQLVQGCVGSTVTADVPGDRAWAWAVALHRVAGMAAAAILRQTSILSVNVLVALFQLTLGDSLSLTLCSRFTEDIWREKLVELNVFALELGRRGVSWVSFFKSEAVESRLDFGRWRNLNSDALLKGAPVIFLSLLEALVGTWLGGSSEPALQPTVTDVDLLVVAVEMHSSLASLFASPQRESTGSLHLSDTSFSGQSTSFILTKLVSCLQFLPLDLIHRSKQLLLRLVPRCPCPARTHETWLTAVDPELRAALDHFSQRS
ncbi:Fanconi anemia group A protein isoform X1 [Petromyzon marinus]|uniref:Fanconi anemia group A protein isoform X1 n=1 Tax=Petromyzon marinus TaxID=7757 RepID=UPI003F6EDC40